MGHFNRCEEQRIGGWDGDNSRDLAKRLEEWGHQHAT